MRAPGSLRNPRRATQGAIGEPEVLAILAGAGALALQQTRPETVTRAERHALSPANYLPRRSASVPSTAAPRVEFALGTV